MTEHDLSKRAYRIDALLTASGWIAFAMPPSLLGQEGTANTPATSSPANPPYVATMTYDVASVRENKNADPNIGITMSGRFVPHRARFQAINWSIENLIGAAYGANISQIVGVPKWRWPTVFVIEAKGDSDADAKMAALTPERQLAEQRHTRPPLAASRVGPQREQTAPTAHNYRAREVWPAVVRMGEPQITPAIAGESSKETRIKTSQKEKALTESVGAIVPSALGRLLVRPITRRRESAILGCRKPPAQARDNVLALLNSLVAQSIRSSCDKNART